MESENKLTAVERKKQDTDFVGTKHADLVLRSVHVQEPHGEDGEGIRKRVRPRGSCRARCRITGLYDKYTKPVLEQLYADGAVTAYGVDAEVVHTGDPGLRFFWQVLPDADALDKVEAAYAAARAKRSPEERRSIGMAFAELTDPTAHRDSQANVIYYSAK